MFIQQSCKLQNALDDKGSVTWSKENLYEDLAKSITALKDFGMELMIGGDLNEELSEKGLIQKTLISEFCFSRVSLHYRGCG